MVGKFLTSIIYPLFVRGITHSEESKFHKIEATKETGL